jgi:hypothetical protein
LLRPESICIVVFRRVEGRQHLRARAIAALALWALGGGPAALADSDIPRCPAPFGKLLANEVFKSYPARKPVSAIKPVLPRVEMGKPHNYRTTIREEAKGGRTSEATTPRST